MVQLSAVGLTDTGHSAGDSSGCFVDEFASNVRTINSCVTRLNAGCGCSVNIKLNFFFIDNFRTASNKTFSSSAVSGCFEAKCALIGKFGSLMRNKASSSVHVQVGANCRHGHIGCDRSGVDEVHIFVLNGVVLISGIFTLRLFNAVDPEAVSRINPEVCCNVAVVGINCGRDGASIVAAGQQRDS